MSFTLVGFTESQDSATLVNVAALADQHVTVSGDDITVPEYNRIVGYYVLGPNVTQAQISSPSLRELGLIDIESADLGAEPSSPASFHDLFDNPKNLVDGEVLQALASEDGAGATRATVLVWLSDGRNPPVRGKDILTIRFTGTTTLTANAWTNGSLVASQTLAAGTYDVVGMRAQAAGLQAARLVFRGRGQGWRPGVIGQDADSDLDVARFRFGNAGVWGSFRHNEMPNVDYLSNSADTAETVYLDLVKTG